MRWGRPGLNVTEFSIRGRKNHRPAPLPSRAVLFALGTDRRRYNRIPSTFRLSRVQLWTVHFPFPSTVARVLPRTLIGLLTAGVAMPRAHRQRTKRRPRTKGSRLNTVEKTPNSISIPPRRKRSRRYRLSAPTARARSLLRAPLNPSTALIGSGELAPNVSSKSAPK